MSNTGIPRVVELGAGDHGRWEDYVRGHPLGLVYHHPLWLATLVAESGTAPLTLAVEDGHRRLRGVMPMLRTRGLPGFRAEQIASPRLSSLPRTPIAGPLADDDPTATLLVRAATARATAEGLRLEIKPSPDAPAGVSPARLTAWRRTYVVDLPDDPDDMRFGEARNHARIRWAVKRAAKQGIVIRAGSAAHDLRAWYRLYVLTLRRHGVPPRSLGFFRALCAALEPRGLLRLQLAEQASDDHAVLVAGSLLLAFNTTVFYAYNGVSDEGLALRANDALQWHALRDACREGFRRYDLGEVSADNPGLAEFKRKWGSREVHLTRYHHPPVAGHADATARRRGLVPLIRRGWTRVPPAVTALAGRAIYRRL